MCHGATRTAGLWAQILAYAPDRSTLRFLPEMPQPQRIPVALAASGSAARAGGSGQVSQLPRVGAVIVQLDELLGVTWVSERASE